MTSPASDGCSGPERATRDVTGRARYLFRLNPGLRRTLVARWARWKRAWSSHDGLCEIDEATRTMLAAHRLRARPYSPSSLQHFAVCPYKFLLASVHRLHLRDEIEPPVERMDPLTRVDCSTRCRPSSSGRSIARLNSR